MWKTDEDYLRREGFLCNSIEDFAELRLRAPDDDDEPNTVPESQKCVDEFGNVYEAVLARPRDEIAMNSKKKRELRDQALAAIPGTITIPPPTIPRKPAAP
jgi:hypothetical protein